MVAARPMVRMSVDTSSREPTNHKEIFFLLAKPSMRKKRVLVSWGLITHPLCSWPSHLESCELQACPLPTQGNLIQPGLGQVSSLPTPSSLSILSKVRDPCLRLESGLSSSISCLRREGFHRLKRSQPYRCHECQGQLCPRCCTSSASCWAFWV